MSRTVSRRSPSRDVATVGLMVAVIEVCKFFMQGLPNIEMTSFLIILFTLHFGPLVIYAVPVFILIEGMLYGVNLWWIMYLYTWPLLALVTVVIVPVSILVVTYIAKRSQPQFIEQWRRTGTLNGHVEEMYTGHALVTVFGHEDTAQETFAEENEALFQASYRAQFIR